MFISKWLIYCSLKPIGQYGDKKKKSHITLIMTPVPDGAKGKHFTNETRDSFCVEPQSAASYADPHVPVLLWRDGFLMTPLPVIGFSLNYRTMVDPLSKGCKASELSYTTSKQPFVQDVMLLADELQVYAVEEAAHWCRLAGGVNLNLSSYLGPCLT